MLRQNMITSNFYNLRYVLQVACLSSIKQIGLCRLNTVIFALTKTYGVLWGGYVLLLLSTSFGRKEIIGYSAVNQEMLMYSLK